MENGISQIVFARAPHPSPLRYWAHFVYSEKKAFGLFLSVCVCFWGSEWVALAPALDFLTLVSGALGDVVGVLLGGLGGATGMSVFLRLIAS